MASNRECGAIEPSTLVSVNDCRVTRVAFVESESCRREQT